MSVALRIQGIRRHGVRVDVRVSPSHPSALRDMLACSGATRAALARSRYGPSAAPLAKATLAECRKRGVELRVTRGWFRVARLTTYRNERASQPLLAAIREHSDGLVALLRDPQLADHRHGGVSETAVQGRLF